MRVPLVANVVKALAFVRQESRLLTPVALAVLGVGVFASGEAQSIMVKSAVDVAAIAVFLLASAVICIGALAIRALVLVPQCSVLEALVLGLRRMPRLLVIRLAMLALLMASFMPLTPGTPPSDTPQSGILALIAFGGYTIHVYLSARLFCVPAIIADQDLSLQDALGLSWRLTRASQWALMGVIFWVDMMGLLLAMFVASAVGLVAGSLDGALAAPGLALMVAGLASALVGSLFNMMVGVFSAFFYRDALAAQ
jgi:hypothetical protein